MSNQATISSNEKRNTRMVITTLEDGRRITQHLPINASIPMRQKGAERRKYNEAIQKKLKEEKK